jgi:hypothetical protein
MASMVELGWRAGAVEMAGTKRQILEGPLKLLSRLHPARLPRRARQVRLPSAKGKVPSRDAALGEEATVGALGSNMDVSRSL